MATIDINLSQAANDFLFGAAGDAGRLVAGIAEGLVPLDPAGGTLTWRQLEDNTIEVFSPDGATMRFTGATLPLLYDGKFHGHATGITLLQDGVVTARQAGTFDFVFTAKYGNTMVLDSITGMAASGAVGTLFPADADALGALGNIELSYEGTLGVDSAGGIYGTVNHLALAADAVIARATADGSLRIATDAAGEFFIGGTLGKASIEFQDGSFVTVDRAAFELDGAAALPWTLLADTAALGGDDQINVILPDTLADSVLVASGAGRDAVIVGGGGGKLHVNAGDGDDVIAVLNDNHFIEGGDGSDSVIFAGARDSYEVIVTDLGAAVRYAEGYTGATLTNVERVFFDDTALALDTAGPAGQAYRLYQAVLDRAPDAAGLGYWIGALDGGATMQEVATSLMGSAEGSARFAAGAADAEFLDTLYQNVLHRAPDAAGQAYWLGALQHGLTRADLVVEFSEGAENVAQVSEAIASGITYIPYW